MSMYLVSFHWYKSESQASTAVPLVSDGEPTGGLPTGIAAGGIAIPAETNASSGLETWS